MSRDYDEKRDFIRMCIDGPMSYSRQDDSTVYAATARDLSGSGLGFVTAMPLSLGELLQVSVVPGTSIVAPLRAEVEVVRAEAHDSGGYDIGVAIKRFL